MSSSKKCDVCKGYITVEYRQRRSADEPPDRVETCYNCPLLTDRLDLPSLDEVPEYAGNENKGHKRSSTIISQAEVSYVTGTRQIVSFRGRTARSCAKALSIKGLDRQALVAITVPVRRGSGMTQVEFVQNSNGSFDGLSVRSTDTVAPSTVLLVADVLRMDTCRRSAKEMYFAGYTYTLGKVRNGMSAYLNVIDEDFGDPELRILLDEESPTGGDELVLICLRYAFTTFGTASVIKDFVPSTMVSMLFTQSVKAYDWSKPPEEDYYFTWKPDGERYWLVRYGSVWFYSRRLLSGRIAGWHVSDRLVKCSKAGPILDVEVLIGHDPILIDYLVDPNGRALPSTRRLKEMVTRFSEIADICPSIHVRAYKSKRSKVTFERYPVTYPVDGVVGVHTETMTTVKLKEVKSVELRLEADGSLVTAEGHKVADTDIHRTYEPGNIIELRLSIDQSCGETVVEEVLLRTDKTSANSTVAYENTLSTLTEAPDSLERTQVLNWCNSVRSRVHKLAANRKGGGRVVVVIGAGDGQEAVDYSEDKAITYLLLEPDEDKARKLYRRLRGGSTTRYESGATAFSYIMKALSTGSVKFCIVNSRIEDIMQQDHYEKILKRDAKCCVAPYSISHVSEPLVDLSIDGIPIIGCGYLYDNADDSGTLVDKSGIVMRVESSGRARVKWGGDRVFYEKAIVADDFGETFLIKSAVEHVPVFKNRDGSLIREISNSLYILCTRSF